jgi:AcrR family transcriptional regulator
LIDTAVELIAERGVQGFSLAEASRRLGVAVSAPYRHFADRDELLLAAALRACDVLMATVTAEIAGAHTPEERLMAVARGYARFAVENRPMFETVFGAGTERVLHPSLAAAIAPVKQLFKDAALALAGGDHPRAEALATAVVCTAHGHATMLPLGAFGKSPEAVEAIVSRTGRAAAALIAGRAAAGWAAS